MTITQFEVDAPTFMGDCGTSIHDHWTHTPNGPIRNMEVYGYCLHPYEGRECPDVGTPLVGYAICDEKRVTYSFYPLGSNLPRVEKCPDSHSDQRGASPQRAANLQLPTRENTS